MGWYSVTAVLVALSLKRSSARLEVDFSELRDPAIIELSDQYRANILFSVHSTATFKLRMSPKTMQVSIATERYLQSYEILTWYS